LGDEAAIPALEEVYENDESDEVRSRAWESLQLLRGKT
jgi:HEAT repeat protein